MLSHFDWKRELILYMDDQLVLIATRLLPGMIIFLFFPFCSCAGSVVHVRTLFHGAIRLLSWELVWYTRARCGFFLIR